MSVVKQLLILCCLAGLAYGGYEGYRTYLLPPEEAEAEDPPRPVTIEVAEAKTSRISETVEAVGVERHDWCSQSPHFDAFLAFPSLS